MRTKILVLVAVVIASALPMVAAAKDTFVAPLNGGEQVPVADTRASGNAIVEFKKDGMNYKLITAALINTVAAHIHCGAAGVNGSVGVTLFLGAPVSVNGILAQGPIAGPDAGNVCGWVDLADVRAAIESGDTYVNVHTLANLGGEIRGQLR